MSKGNICACSKSTSNQKDGESSDDNEFTCPKSRGPHAVHRKKYKPNDLNTTGFQCNCDDDRGGNNGQTRTLEVQCDLDSDDDDDDDQNICSNCKCTPGFCGERCETLKQKIGKNRSDSWKTPASAIPVPVKRNSSPGFVTEPKSTCKCVGKCTKECEKRKMTEAVAAMKKANTGNRKDSVSKCAENQCRSACNKSIQTDMEEPPIAPIAGLAPPASTRADYQPKRPQTTDSNVCIACQCNGPCSIECTMNKEELKTMLKPEDLYVSQIDTCLECDCTEKCGKICEEMKMKRGNRDKICEICKCRGTCSPECQKLKNSPKVIQAGGPVPMTANSTWVKGEWDAYKETQTTVTNQATAVASMGVACVMCDCIGDCNELCIASKKTTGSKKNVCDPCDCDIVCHDKCQAAKIEAMRICEVCFCNATCTPRCEAAKKNKSVTKEQAPVDRDKGPVTIEDATQIKGIIENFNNDKLIDNVKTEQVLSKDKAKSTCNFPDQPICDICKCTDGCHPKCAAVRQIKSVAEFPPANTVCEDCKCQDICSIPCEKKKTTTKCVSAAGQPVECSDPNPDWIPCVSCRADAPCSPECRERLALATCMPKAAETLQVKIESQITNDLDAKETCASTAQTLGPTVSCSNAQTVLNNAVMRSTSTPNGLVQPDDFGKGKAACKDSDITLLGGPRELPGDQCQDGDRQECGMCIKLRSYLCSMFQNEQSCSPGQENKDTKGKGNKDKDKTKGLNKKQVSEIVCDCLETFAKGERQEDNRPCKCFKSTAEKKCSYTDRMQSMMGHLRASCEDAELVATPFIKAASVFTLDVNNQQEAIVALLQKCRQKDHYIDALIDDVLDRSKSKVFDNLLTRLKEQNPNAPDFDGTLITSALDMNKPYGAVCGIDLAGFKINSVKRVGATSLLVKWSPPTDGRISGYAINVNGQLKSSIASKDRVYAILDALDFSATISIEIFAIAPKGRASPSILAYYAKY